jgi:hypothetical protein
LVGHGWEFVQFVNFEAEEKVVWRRGCDLSTVGLMTLDIGL